MSAMDEVGVTYRELMEMPAGQLRLLQIVVDRCRRQGLPLDESVGQINWALNRRADV